MNNTSEIKTFGDIQIAKEAVKKRLQLQEAALEQHFHQLPREVVSATFKATVPSIVPALISGTTAGTALKLASGLAGFFLTRSKEKHEKNILKQNVKQGGVMLLATLAGSLLKKFIK